MDIQPLEKAKKRQAKTRAKDEPHAYQARFADTVVTIDKHDPREADPYIQLLLHEGESSVFDIHDHSPAIMQTFPSKTRANQEPQEKSQTLDWFNPWNRRVLSAQAQEPAQRAAENKRSSKKAKFMNLTLPAHQPAWPETHTVGRMQGAAKKSRDISMQLQPVASKTVVLLKKSSEQPDGAANRGSFLETSSKQTQSLPPKPQSVPAWASQSIHQMIWPMNTRLNLEQYLKAKKAQVPTRAKRLSESKEEQKERQLRRIIKDKVNKDNYALFNRNPYFTGALKRMMIREMDTRKQAGLGCQPVDRSLLWDPSKRGLVGGNSPDCFAHPAVTGFHRGSRSGSEPARVRPSQLGQPVVPQKQHQTTVHLTRPGAASFSKKHEGSEDYEAKYPIKSKPRSTADHFFITKPKAPPDARQKQGPLNQMRQ